MGEVKMDRKIFMKELEYLLQDIAEDDRNDALSFYESYFDEAGIDNEASVIEELGEPSRVAAIIKDGLQGRYDDRIHAGNSGFSDDDYKRSYEVIDADVVEEKKATYHKGASHFKEKWNELSSGDKTLLIIIGVFALVPLSFPVLGIFGGFFSFGFSIFSVILCIIFGFWIVMALFYVIAFALIVIGVIHLFTLPGAGLIYMGIGCILIGLGKIFSKIAFWFFKDAIPKMVDAIGTCFAKIFHREAKS